ncbi:MAG: hypothetical protein JWR18_265 [Segetibacter sp.]|nr:hypothetical protein [Segetibacter sp.]
METCPSPSSYFFWLSLKRPDPILPTSLLLAITMMMTGCSELYKINTVTRVNPIDTLEVLKNNKKQFIIHLKDTSFMLANTSIDQNKVGGNLFPLNEIQLKYLYPKSKEKNIYLKEDGYEVLNEVHLYATANSVSDTANFSIPASAIVKIDINEKNVKATKRSYRVGNIILAGTLIGFIIVAITTFDLTFSGNVLGG